jgi:hypothetical protein
LQYKNLTIIVVVTNPDKGVGFQLSDLAPVIAVPLCACEHGELDLNALISSSYTKPVAVCGGTAIVTLFASCEWLLLACVAPLWCI